MFALDNPIRSYAWGSRTALAELLGLASPAAEPQAELWLGAHPSAPSRTADGESLLAAIAADPGGLLGLAVLADFGPTLPFLLKVLAAAEPLSLQAHPDPAQAAAGYADEQARGVPIDAPNRVYRDAGHKPELICALTPFDGLCGFRPVADTLALLAELDIAALRPIQSELEGSPDAAGLRTVLRTLLTGAGALLVPAVAAACMRLAGRGSRFDATLRWVGELAASYPDDDGVAVALLLNLIQLTPGQAVYLPAGNLHAYLRGVGVEVMANSDNVLRGGLTAKHVDVQQLLAALDTRPGPVQILAGERARPGEWRYRTPAREFALSRCEPGVGGLALASSGPQIVLVTEGSVVLAAAGRTLALRRGQSAYLVPADGAVIARGDGVLFRATVPGGDAVPS